MGLDCLLCAIFARQRRGDTVVPEGPPPIDEEFDEQLDREDDREHHVQTVERYLHRTVEHSTVTEVNRDSTCALRRSTLDFFLGGQRSFSRNVNVRHAINFRVLCGANLVT